MLINREIFYIKHSSDDADIEGMPHRAIRPVGMNDADYNTMLNFFRKIVDETKVDGLRYSDETLMKNNLNHFCLSEGTLLFKIIEAVKAPGSGVPELYGFYTPMSGVRAMWLEIDKMCYLLASEVPGSTKDGQIDNELLATYDSNSVHGVKSYYRTSLEHMVKEFMKSSFPFNAALTAAPPELYPQGVKFFSNGMTAEKTDSTLKEVEIEFDNKKIRYTMGKCNPPLKGAFLVSVPYEEETKGGFLRLVKKGEGTAKAVRQWCYDFVRNGERDRENCDFIVLEKAFEYSPIEDTFNAYTGKIGENAERLPRVEGARLVSKVATLEPEEVSEPAPAPVPASESVSYSAPVPAPAPVPQSRNPEVQAPQAQPISPKLRKQEIREQKARAQAAKIRKPEVRKPEPRKPIIQEPPVQVRREPMIQKPPIQAPREPTVREPAAFQEPVVQEPVIREPFIQEPVIQEPQEPIIQEPFIREPTAQEPQAPQEPVAQEPQESAQQTQYKVYTTPYVKQKLADKYKNKSKSADADSSKSYKPKTAVTDDPEYRPYRGVVRQQYSQDEEEPRAYDPKLAKSVKPPKSHEIKQPKPPKPLKTKPGAKIHPLLQQAEEHRREEAEAAANRSRGSTASDSGGEHAHHHYSESARPARSRFGPPQDEADGTGDSATTRRTPPPPPPPPPRGGADRPMRSKFGPKVHPLLRQAEEHENEDERNDTKPAPLPRYSPQRPKQDSENQNIKNYEMAQNEED